MPGLFPAKVGHWSVRLFLTSSGVQRTRVSTKAHVATGIRISNCSHRLVYKTIGACTLGLSVDEFAGERCRDRLKGASARFGR